MTLTQAFGALLMVAGLDALLASLLQSADGQTSDMRALAAGTSVLAAGLLILVPHFGGWGAFWAATGAYVVQTTLRLRALARRLDLGIPWPLVLRMTVLTSVTLISLHHWVPVQPAWLKLVAAALLPPAFLILAWALGCVNVGQWLRTLTQPIVHDEPPLDARFGQLLRQLAEDLRAHDRLVQGPCCNHGQTAVVLYRIARWLRLNHRTFLSRLCWQINLFITKAELPPSTRIGPGFVISHSVGLIAVGHAGRNLTMRAWSAFGVRGRSDAGAGPGMPLIGDGVVLSSRAAIHGGLHCADDVRVPDHMVVVTGRRLAALATQVAARQPLPAEAPCHPS